MEEKISDWICLCASGYSILGDPISEDTLQEVADRYDPAFYCAMIWPHHPWEENGGMLAREVYTPNLGRVAALKTEREDGVLKLYAQYIPNQFLMDLNNQAQKLFASAEFWLNFQEQDYPYLVGVAATDIPASTHTGMMKFSAVKKEKGILQAESVNFSIGDLRTRNTSKKSILNWFFSSKEEPQSKVNTSEEEPENMDELKQLIQDMLAKIEAAIAAGKGETTDSETEAVTEVQAQAEEIVDLAEEVAALAEEVVDNPEDEVLKEEFTAARQELTETIQAFSSASKASQGRRARARRAFSANRRQKKNESGGIAELKSEISELKTLLSSAVKASSTKRPSNAPAGGDKRTVL